MRGTERAIDEVMNDPSARTLPLNDPVFAPLRREDLPSFVAAFPGAEVVAATLAAARLGLPPGAPLPEAAEDAARRIAAADGEAATEARILLPFAAQPQLFSCRAILTPAGQFVMFADPRSLSSSAAADGGAAASSRLDAGGPSARPVRFTWEVDAAGRLTQLSEAFATSLPAEGWLGRPLLDVLADLGFSGGEGLASALAAVGSFSGIALEGERGRIVMGGVTRPAPPGRGLATHGSLGAQGCVGARGFGQIWLQATVAPTGAPGAAEGPSSPPQVDRPAPIPAQGGGTDVPHSGNVVPLRGGTLTPRERTAFHEIARTLHDAIDSWQKPGEDAAPAETEDADRSDREGAFPAPSPEAEAEDGVLDRLPLGVMVQQHGELVRVNRTLLSWCGDGDMEAFLAAGGLPARLSRPDSLKPLSLRMESGAEVPVEVRVVSATWGGRPALVHVVRRLDEAAGPGGEAAAGLSALQKTLDLIPVGVVLLDRAGAIEESNETLVRYSGFARGDLRGEPFTALFAPHSKSRAVLLLDEAALQAAPVPSTALLTVRGRKGADVEMVGSLARVESDAQRFCLVLRPADESESARAAAVRAAGGPRADALDMPQARAAVDALARRMSHAVRTPLTSILGFVDAVRSATFGPVGNARYAKHAEAAQMAGQNLLALLEDVEHLFPPAPATEPDRVDLSLTVASAIGHLDDMVKRRRILVRRDMPETMAGRVRPAAAEHVVRLLLEEALRATPVGGQVVVSLRQEEDQVVLRVRDEGPALSEVEIAQALDALATAPVSDRFSAAGRPFRFARLSALVRAEGGSLALRRGVGGGLLAELSFPA